MSADQKLRVVPFGGFNKEDVIKYIEEIEFNFNQTMEKKSLEITKLNKDVMLYEQIVRACNVEKDQVQEFVNECIEAKVELESVKENSETLQKEFDEVKFENNRMAASIRSKALTIDEQVKTAVTEKNELFEENKKLRAEILSFHKLKETVLQLEINANIRAEELEQQAKLRAEQIIAQAQKEADVKMLQANQNYNKIVNENIEKCQSIKKEAMVKVCESVKMYESLSQNIELLNEINYKIKEQVTDFEKITVEGLDNYANSLAETVEA